MQAAANIRNPYPHPLPNMRCPINLPGSRCFNCNGELQVGVDAWWQVNPNRRFIGDKDNKVHWDCWKDIEWSDFLSKGTTMPALVPRPIMQTTNSASIRHIEQNQQARVEDSVDLSEYARPHAVKNIHPAREFDWAIDHMQNEEITVRRRNWADGYKHLKIERDFGIPVVYVITQRSKHVYTYPKDDQLADDWEAAGF